MTLLKIKGARGMRGSSNCCAFFLGMYVLCVFLAQSAHGREDNDRINTQSFSTNVIVKREMPQHVLDKFNQTAQTNVGHFLTSFPTRIEGFKQNQPVFYFVTADIRGTTAVFYLRGATGERIEELKKSPIIEIRWQCDKTGKTWCVWARDELNNIHLRPPLYEQPKYAPQASNAPF